MNCEACELKELEVEYFEIREVLRCILHTIVFHRALGLVRPKDIDCELFEITYGVCLIPDAEIRVFPTLTSNRVQCGDAVVEKKIEEKIDEFINKVEKHPNRKSQICLSFYEVKKNKQATWFSNKVERLFWEQWYVNLHVINPKAHGKSHHNRATADLGGGSEEQTSRHAALESSLREVLFQIIRFVNEKKDHLPPIPIQEGILFPYEITILSSSDSSFGGWHTDVLKRMLQTGHPTLI